MRCFLVAALAGLLGTPQTIVDAARREAERRKALGEQGIEGKVIECPDPGALAPKGNLTVWAPVSRPSSARTSRSSAQQPSAKGGDRFRATFQKLDREIRQAEDRLALLTRRLADQKRAPPVSTRATTGAVPLAEQKLRREIEDLQLKLKRLQSERLDAYNSARKAGLLPGEIDGKGITP